MARDIPPEAANKVRLLGAYADDMEPGIPDPYDLDPVEARLVFDKIAKVIDRLIK